MNWAPDQLRSLRHLLRLKTVLRRGWTRHPIPRGDIESVADHSYGVVLLALLMCPPELNRSRVLELAVLHDLAEVETGDFTPHDGIPGETKRKLEREAFSGLLEELPNRDHLVSIFVEYQEATSAEARWVKSIDKLEMTLQSLNYEDDYGVELQEFRDSALGAMAALGLEPLSREKIDLSSGPLPETPEAASE